MITIFRASGNHSNRLFQTIHFEAFCKEAGLRYANPSFEDMADYYGIEKKAWHKPFCSVANFLYKLKILKGLDCNEDGKQKYYEELLRKKKNLLVCGWNFRVYDLTAKYQDYFATKYALLPEFYKSNPLYQQLQKVDRSAVAIVGVHIRRGDYRTWQNGRYYFEDPIYEKYMSEMESQLKLTDRKPLFLIFSNEDISIKVGEGVWISKNDWFVDQFLMSQCDYLLGPPSTFTLWASYVGKVPYYHFESSLDKIDLNRFNYCIG